MSMNQNPPTDPLLPLYAPTSRQFCFITDCKVCYSVPGGCDVASCLVPCSFQGSLSPEGSGYPPVLTSSGGHCSGRYASYWNAFLLHEELPTLQTVLKYFSRLNLDFSFCRLISAELISDLLFLSVDHY